MKLSENLSSLGKGTLHMGLASTEFTKQWNAIWIRALKNLQLVQYWAWWGKSWFPAKRIKNTTYVWATFIYEETSRVHCHSIWSPFTTNEFLSFVGAFSLCIVWPWCFIKQAVLESGRLYFSKSYWLSEVHKEAPSKPEYSLEYQHKTSRAQQDKKVTQITLINIACAKFMCRACHDS